MSNSSGSDQPPEVTEQTEMIPIVDLEPPPAFPPLPPPPEDELGPVPEYTNMNASAFPSSPYGIMPVILVSLLLLVLCGFFGYQYFESVQALESKMNNLNQWIESFQNKAENLPQVQIDLDEIKETLDWLQRHLIEVLQELNAKQGDQCGPPLQDWVTYGDYSYLQSTEMVSWSKCSDVCASLNATFLTTERNRLMNITVLPSATRTWLGLSYNETDQRWEWDDGSSPSFDLSSPNPSLDFQGICAYVNAHTIRTDYCTVPSSCMCEKPVL